MQLEEGVKSSPVKLVIPVPGHLVLPQPVHGSYGSP